MVAIPAVLADKDAFKAATSQTAVLFAVSRGIGRPPSFVSVEYRKRKKREKRHIVSTQQSRKIVLQNKGKLVKSDRCCRKYQYKIPKICWAAESLLQ